MRKSFFRILLILCMALVLMPAAVKAEDIHTNHCICGVSHTNIGNHQTEVTPTWIAVSDINRDGMIDLAE